MKVLYRFDFFLAVLTGLFSCLAVQAAPVAVTDLKIVQSSDGARLVFNVSRAVTPKIFSLENPDRIVIDMDDAQVAKKISKTSLVAPVKAIRIATQKDHGLRVVLEVAQPLRSTGLLMQSPKQGRQLIVNLAKLDASSSKPDSVLKSDLSKDAEVEKNKAPIIGHSSRKLRDIVIAIDAGHGGDDPGAIGPAGIREKDVVLSIARKLKVALEEERGFQTGLTREGDYFIELANRRQIAKEKYNADLFISIHADSWVNRQARGASVYVVSRRGASSALAKYLADSENNADLIRGVSIKNKDETLRNVLADLAMEGSLEHSLEAGHSVLSEVGKIAPLHKSGIEQAGFVVLKSLHMPSMLVETGFISNEEEARKLNDEAYQSQLASAIAKGIKRYFENQPPPGTYFADQSGANVESFVLDEPATKKNRFSKETVARVNE